MVSVTNGATPVPATNGESLNGDSEKAIENGENGKTQPIQPSVGVKRKDDGGITKDSKAPDLKKIRLFKDSDEEDDPDDPSPQTNGNSSDTNLEEEDNSNLESNKEIESELTKR